MNFIKKHYEKVLLGVVLAGLLGAVIWLLLAIERERDAMEGARNKILNLTVKEIPPLDLSRQDEILKQCQTPLELTLSAPPHNLINPVPWQKTVDGRLIPLRTGREVGPDRVEVTKITPLYMIISYESYNSAGSNYLIKVERETERSNRRISRYVGVGGKTENFILREVKGPPAKPTELVLELTENGQQVSIAPDKPYRRVEGYAADLKYELEHRTWNDLRKDARLSFAGDDFTVASINLIASNQYEVVLSAKSTGKKTTIKYNAAP